ILALRQIRTVAVDRGRRRVDDTTNARATRRLQHVQRAGDVVVVGAKGVLHRAGNRTHRRLMEDDVDAARGRLHGVEVADVALDRGEGGGEAPAELEVGATARREIVEDADPMTLAEETTGDVGADEAGAAGDQKQRRHEAILTERRGRCSKLNSVSVTLV